MTTQSSTMMAISAPRNRSGVRTLVGGGDLTAGVVHGLRSGRGAGSASWARGEPGAPHSSLSWRMEGGGTLPERTALPKSVS